MDLLPTVSIDLLPTDLVSIDLLPTEILCLIFGYLNKKDALGVFWTCKRFAEAISITRINYKRMWNIVNDKTNMISKYDFWNIQTLPNNKFILNLMKQSMVCKRLCTRYECMSFLEENNCLSSLEEINIHLSDTELFPSILGKIKKVTASHCHLSEIDLLEDTEILILEHSSTEKISNAPKLRKLISDNNFYMRDLGDLTNLQEIEINGCYNRKTITNNIIFPNNVRKLKLTNIMNREIGENLPNNLEYLILRTNKNLQDISQLTNLSNLKKVKIILCDEIKSISPLRNITKLKLQSGRHKSPICDFLMLTNPNIFKNLTELCLTEIYINCNIALPENIKKFQLYDCYTISNISNLQNLIELTIVGCNFLEYISDISNVKKVYIEFCDDIHTIINVNNVEDLYLGSLNKLFRIKNLDAINRVEVECCFNIVDISGLYNVQNINLSSISYLMIHNFDAIINNENLKSLIMSDVDQELEDILNILTLKLGNKFVYNIKDV